MPRHSRLRESGSVPGRGGGEHCWVKPNREDAIHESLAARAELGLPLTVATKEIEVAV